MKGIGKIFETKYGGLIFSLLCGAAYYVIALNFIIASMGRSGTLFGFFFFPAIICGMGLILFKTVLHLKENEEFSKINLLLWAHIVLMLLSLVFLADVIF